MKTTVKTFQTDVMNALADQLKAYQRPTDPHRLQGHKAVVHAELSLFSIPEPVKLTVCVADDTFGYPNYTLGFASVRYDRAIIAFPDEVIKRYKLTSFDISVHYHLFNSAWYDKGRGFEQKWSIRHTCAHQNSEECASLNYMEFERKVRSTAAWCEEKRIKNWQLRQEVYQVLLLAERLSDPHFENPFIYGTVVPR